VVVEQNWELKEEHFVVSLVVTYASHFTASYQQRSSAQIHDSLWYCSPLNTTGSYCHLQIFIRTTS